MLSAVRCLRHPSAVSTYVVSHSAPLKGRHAPSLIRTLVTTHPAYSETSKARPVFRILRIAISAAFAAASAAP